MTKYNKELIIGKGIELMRSKGYHGTGVQHILKALQMPKGSFYNFFESKEDFTLQAIEEYGKTTINDLMNIVEDSTLSSFQVIESFFGNLVAYYEANQFRQTCLMSILSFELGNHNPAISQKIRDKFNRIRQILAGVIQEGQGLGEIRGSIDPAEMADFLINGFNGSLISMKYEQSINPLRKFMEINLSLIKAK